MAKSRTLAIAAALMTLASCATQQGEGPLTIAPSSKPADFASLDPGTRTLGASGFWIPYMRIDPDVDETEPGGGRVLDADLESGSGYGAAVQYGTDSAGGRVTFVTTDHGEEVSGGDADLYWGDAELYLGTRWDLGFVALNPQIGPGIGVAVLRLPAPFDDEWGGTLSVAARSRSSSAIASRSTWRRRSS